MKKYVNIRGELFDLSKPRVMGILNVSPDSFYAESRSLSPLTVERNIEHMISSGVDIIDIGGYSSRPGASDISINEEVSRISMALEVIRRRFPKVIISLDTFRSNVARVGIEDFDVDIINDISGGDLDKKMYPLIAEKNVPYILMHMKGAPGTMQLNPRYKHVVNELLLWFSERINRLVSYGVNDIIIDPGFGFGKTLDHNYQIMRELDRFETLGLPLLVGLSRKSMIWEALNITPEKSLHGTIALNMLALSKGANILRVHDVADAVETVKLFCKTSNAS